MNANKITFSYSLVQSVRSAAITKKEMPPAPNCYGIGERTHSNDTLVIQRSHASYALQFIMTLVAGFFWHWQWFNPVQSDLYEARGTDDEQQFIKAYCQYPSMGKASTAAVGWVALSVGLLAMVQQSLRPRTLSLRVNTMYAVVSLLGLASYLFMNLAFNAWFGEFFRSQCTEQHSSSLAEVLHITINIILFVVQLVVIIYYIWMVNTDTRVDGDLEEESTYED